MKMLLLNLGLLFAISAEAQFPLFYKVLPTPVYSTHQSDFGLHIIVSGHQLIVSDLFGNEFGQRSVNLFKLDSVANIVKQLRIDGSSQDIWFANSSFCHDNDGNLFFTGGSTITLDDQPTAILKTTENLDSIWLKYYSDNIHISGGYSIQEMPDGNLLLLTSEGYYNFFLWLKLTKIDKNGTIIWQKMISGSLDHILATSLFPTMDGNFLVTAREVYGVHPGQSLPQESALITKVDPEGDVLWTRNTTNDFTDPNTHPIATPLKDGSFAFVWDTLSASNDSLQNVLFKAINCIDLNGNFIWKLPLFAFGGGTIEALKTTANGDILGCGGFQPYDNQVHSFRSHGWLFRASPQGQLLWQRFIMDSTLLQYPVGSIVFTDLAEAPDGGILVTGQLIDSSSKVVVLSLNSEGCLSPACANDAFQYLSPTHEPVRDKLASISLIPNPSDEFVHVKLADLEIKDECLEVFDLTSKRVFLQLFSGQESDIPTMQLPNSVYSVRITQKGIPVAIGKLAVIH